MNRKVKEEVAMCAKRIRFTDHPSLPFEEWEDSRSAEHPWFPGQRHYPDSGKDQDTDLGIADADRNVDRRSERNLHYISLGSGSSGNCCYVGSSAGGIIIDAGVKTEDVERMLLAKGISMKSVKALLITHDHSDHVRYAYNMVRNNKHMRIFCTNRVLNGILRRHSISKRIKEYHTPIFKEIPFRILDFEITAFEVPHDGTDNMGFSIEFDSRRFVLATDLGAVTERARHYMSLANYLVIEANYDLDMLRNGRYPEYLKARIQTENGHMDNRDTGAFLREIVNPGLQYVFLCHLSQDNNTPAKAIRAVRDALTSAGKTVGNACEIIRDRKADVQLMALPRFEPSRLFIFRPVS